jgi:hypothetical protein
MAMATVGETLSVETLSLVQKFGEAAARCGGNS